MTSTATVSRGTLCIVQARMSSTRLPSKVTLPVAEVGGRTVTMLGLHLRRLARCKRLDGCVVASPWLKEGDEEVAPEIAAIAREEGVEVAAGPEDDVLARYVRTVTACSSRPAVVVRTTADCPLIDPALVDQVVEALTKQDDLASDVVRRSYPRGVDAEALHEDTLRRLDRMATEPRHREHVTLLAYDWRMHFVLASVEQDDGYPWPLVNLSVDTEEDLTLVRDVARRVDPVGAGWAECGAAAFAASARLVLEAQRRMVGGRSW